MKRIAVAALACIVPMTALAADKEGRSAIEGAGFADCQTFVQEREKKSTLYFRLGGWVEGYMTAANEYMDDTFDLSPWQNTELLLLLVNNHCTGNPEQNFGTVIRALSQALMANRMTEQSPIVDVTEGDQDLKIYREVIVRLQEALKQQGFYDGGLDGDFGPGTRAALKAYQDSVGIQNATGFPDQMSLYRLLTPESGMQPPQP